MLKVSVINGGYTHPPYFFILVNPRYFGVKDGDDNRIMSLGVDSTGWDSVRLIKSNDGMECPGVVGSVYA